MDEKCRTLSSRRFFVFFFFGYSIPINRNVFRTVETARRQSKIMDAPKKSKNEGPERITQCTTVCLLAAIIADWEGGGAEEDAPLGG